MQLERRLVYHAIAQPILIASGCKESGFCVMQETFKVSDYVTNHMRVQLLAKYGSKVGAYTPLRRAAQRRVASVLARGKVSSSLSPKDMLRGTAFLFTFNGDWGRISMQVGSEALTEVEAFVAHLRTLD